MFIFHLLEAILKENSYKYNNHKRAAKNTIKLLVLALTSINFNVFLKQFRYAKPVLCTFNNQKN